MTDKTGRTETEEKEKAGCEAAPGLRGHPHVYTRDIMNRLSRAIGHLNAIKNMVEEGRDCSEILIQLSAVKSAINNTGKLILQDHIEHCIVDAIEHDDKDAIRELEIAIDRFIK